MQPDRWPAEAQNALQEVLGYLNFSSGMPDPRWQRNLNLLFGFAPTLTPEAPPWRVVCEVLAARLAELEVQSPAFQDARQAHQVLLLTLDHLLPEFWRFHRDLLFHQHSDAMIGPFFLAAAFELVLQRVPASDDPGEPPSAEWLYGALTAFNDYLGYRPVAVLRSEQKIQPYVHEWTRPVPLFLRGVGVARGHYEPLVTRAIEILQQMPADLLEEAYFDPAVLDELAYDPRGYDFEHPVNKRPNYHFGTWDLQRLDQQGRYRRFVWQQVTLDLLLMRLQQENDRPTDELLWEAAAVLAGITLMASFLGGRSPETHDSSVTLSNLLPRIAKHRDRFYQSVLQLRQGPHGDFLRDEANRLHQPLAGARQHLNQSLARMRAKQLQHVHLARLFARMDFPEAAIRQTQIVQVPSARLTAELDSRIAAAHHALDRGELSAALARVPEAEDLLHRAIECGALIDPWNILGFQGQFSVFSALENSVHDPRVEELVQIVGQIFGLYARLLSETAATGDQAAESRLARGMQQLARWWDKYATTEVAGAESFSGQTLYEAATRVATVLRVWHEAGAGAGDLAFWSKQTQHLTSPKAYALVVESLLEKGDDVAAMALLIHWAGRGGEVPLADNEHSFHALLTRWLRGVLAADKRPLPARPEAASTTPEARWQLVRKLFDYLEANAEEFWQVPQFTLGGGRSTKAADSEPVSIEHEDDEDSGEGDGLYQAAYEQMTYRDSTGDGNEGSTLEQGDTDSDYALAHEAPRLTSRLAFLSTLARAWKLAAGGQLGLQVECAADDKSAGARRETVEGWYRQAVENQKQLLRLMEQVHDHHIPAPRGTQESLVEYDRRRSLKQALLERVIVAYVATADAARFMLATLPESTRIDGLVDWELPAVAVLRGVLSGDPEHVRERLPELFARLAERPLLYVPLTRGGVPQAIAATQVMEELIRELLSSLSRLGLLNETVQLLTVAQNMERQHPVGAGAVTEFDRLFQAAYQGVLQCILDSAPTWDLSAEESSEESTALDEQLLMVLQSITERLLHYWLSHSRMLRLSTLEKIAGEQAWKSMRSFIEKFGHDLFTPRFLNAGNLRAILDQGVDAYLRQLEENADDDQCPQLIEELDLSIPRAEAVKELSIIIEAVLENYVEYRDYNSTTTQSDRGELLYSFLDCLRLKARYERVLWNLRPVILAHQMLEREGFSQAADHWRKTVAERTASAADWHLERLGELTKKYGMRLPTVADRLEERFVRPLSLDRIRVLVRPAMDEARAGQPGEAFAALEREVAELSAHPTGSGLDTPAWLVQLENEVEQTRLTPVGGGGFVELLAHVPPARLSLEQLNAQIGTWDTPA